MICSLDELRRKEVIDINNGERLGYIDDVRIDLRSSAVEALLIYGRMRLFGVLGKEDDVVIPCGDIRVVGSDVVLISQSSRHELSTDTKNKENSQLSLFESTKR